MLQDKLTRSRHHRFRVMHPKLRWLIFVQLLLMEPALCRAAPPLTLKTKPVSNTHILEVRDVTTLGQHPLLASQPQVGVPSGPEDDKDLIEVITAVEDRVQSAQRIVATLTKKLHGNIQNRFYFHKNASCEELFSASLLEDPSSTVFPQELLCLSLVPVLLMANCPLESQALVLRLFDLLGVEDTEDLLMEVEDLMERRTPRPRATASPAGKGQEERRFQAVMFNIQQLARAGENEMGQAASQSGKQLSTCQSWIRVNGTLLLGKPVEGATRGLEEAVRACENLGSQCAGVSHAGVLQPRKYQAVLRPGSRVVPSEQHESECWIHHCEMEEGVSEAAGRRFRRSAQRNCVHEGEERIYNVVEWIPAVSTLYNLGTAVYYASVNCSEAAKERAILSAVDLGTDALMAVTGGTAGVAGYALGAGVKTGVKASIKYLLSSMKQEEDLLVNQYSWEERVITIQ